MFWPPVFRPISLHRHGYVTVDNLISSGKVEGWSKFKLRALFFGRNSVGTSEPWARLGWDEIQSTY